MTAVAGGVAIAPLTASADELTPGDGVVSAAHGHGLFVDLSGLNLLGTASTQSAHDDQGEDAWPASDSGGLDLSLLGLDLAAALGLGGGVQLPLVQQPGSEGGLLDLGDLDALVSNSDSPSATSSTASSGIAGEGSSGVNLDPNAVPANYAPTTLDVSALLAQILGNDITSTVLDEASIKIGALGAQASKVDSTEATRGYLVADLEANVHSPLVGDLSGVLTGAVEEIVKPVNGLVGEGGLVNGVITDLSSVIDAVDTRVFGTGVVLNSDATKSGATITGLDALVTDTVKDLLAEQISNEDGSVVIDLSTGTIHVDLAQFVLADYNANLGEGATPANNLSELAPNTEVLTPEVVTAITNGVTEALTGNGPDSLMTKLHTLLSDNLWNTVGIDININANGQVCLAGACQPLVEGDVTISGTLAEFAGYNDAALSGDNISTTLNLLGIIPVGDLLNAVTSNLLAPIVNQVTGPLLTLITDDVLGNVQTILQDQLLAPVLTPLLEALQSVLKQVVSLTINEQSEGDLGANSYTVRALSTTLLPQSPTNLLKLELASATAMAEDPQEVTATLNASPNPVDQGGTVTLTGEGFEASEHVTITLPDDTTTVTADENGAIETTWDVPADYTPGAADFTATGQTSDRSATASTTVQEAGAGADANVNASASASASAQAAADDDATASAQVAAQAAALADNTSDASAAADVTANAAAEAAANEDASTTASADVLADANVAASASAQASADSTADSAQDADASAGASAAANADASSAAQAASEASAEADASNAASADASADLNANAAAAADANVNASASASASADADDNSNASAQAAAQAAALADNTSDASAASDATADAAASAAADEEASTNASAESNAAASASAQAAANSEADSDSAAAATAEASAAATADARAAASAASEASANATSSDDASATASADVDADANAAANVNASASASASAKADDDSNASAQAAAEAAALANNESDASAAADMTANAAAEAAANEDASTTASADVSSDVNAAAQAAAQASADSTADSAQDAQASAAADAAASADSESAARAASEAAAEANSSSTASSNAAADVTADASSEAAATTSTSSNANASASADAKGASAAASADAKGADAKGADAKGGDAKGNGLAATGAGSLAPLGIAAIAMLILGAGAVLLQRRRSKLQ